MEAPARVLMNVGPNMHFLHIFMLTKEIIFGTTNVVSMYGTDLQITFQVSAKKNGSRISVTRPTMRMYETMAEDMLMPMKVVAKTIFASAFLKLNLPKRASMTDCRKWTNWPSRATIVKSDATTMPIAKPRMIASTSCWNQSRIVSIWTYIKLVAPSGRSARANWKYARFTLEIKLTDLSTAVLSTRFRASSNDQRIWKDCAKIYAKDKKASMFATRRAEGKKKASSSLNGVRKVLLAEEMTD
mmetsp:Transcript_12788/g.30422  ORF Transcript_12788/g.30422 Transcript_12788/m.30422 type:complete len:243 (-) Transcript_12788:1392-2120(-)